MGDVVKVATASDIDELVDQLLAARALAIVHGEDLIAYFLDMALLDLAKRGPRVEGN